GASRSPGQLRTVDAPVRDRCVFFAAGKIAESTINLGTGAAAVGTSHRRDLPPGNGAAEPLFRCVTPQPVRRVDLVRRDLGGPRAHDPTVCRTRTSASLCHHRRMRIHAEWLATMGDTRLVRTFLLDLLGS